MNRAKKIVLASFMLGVASLNSFAQSDSLRLIWEDESTPDTTRFKALETYRDLYSHAQPDSALIYMDYYYQLGNKKQAYRQVYRALNEKGNIYRNKRQLDSALNYYREATIVAKELNNPVLQAIITGNIGNVFYEQKKYLEATREYSNALQVFQEEKDKEGEARILTSLGSVNNAIGNYELALEYYQKSLKIYTSIEEKGTGIAIIHMNMGLIHFEKQTYVDAENDFEIALKLLEETQNNYFISGCYSLLAQIHYKLNQIDEAKRFAKKNLALNKTLDNSTGIFEAKIILAHITFETEKLSALKMGRVFLDSLTEKTPYELKESVYELLYKSYKFENKLDSALIMHELLLIYQDSIQKEKNNFAVVRELVKNDYKLRFYENKLENEKEKMALKVAALKRTFALVVTPILLIICIVFYFRSKMKKSTVKRDLLLEEIDRLKNESDKNLMVIPNQFQLDRAKIEEDINRKLNETDWKVLNALLEDPVITNKEIADKVFMSVDGIGSSLRRMYDYFNIKESNYKKISLILEGIKISNK